MIPVEYQGGLPAPPVPAKLPRVLVWFRRDLRLDDNLALNAALVVAEEVVSFIMNLERNFELIFLCLFSSKPFAYNLHHIYPTVQVPVYVYTPEEEGQFQPGRCSRWWLDSSLKSLEAELIAAGSRLLKFRAAESGIALAKLVHDLDAQGVFFNHLYDPISMVRDNEVKEALTTMGIACRSFTGDVLREPWEVLDPNGVPFSSFDTFWAAHCAIITPPAAPVPAASSLPPVAATLDSFGHDDLGIMTPEEELSNAQLEYHWQPGTSGGRRHLKEFIEGDRLKRFEADRAKTDRNSTSKLSPHIHFGEVSARGVYAAATAKGKEWEKNNTNNDGSNGSVQAVNDFLRQLGYREYSRYLSFHFPFTHERSLLEHLRAVPWRFDQALFKAWRTGNSGYPLIDAGMREVWSTGWMHNRIRVVAASFMVKILLLPWQWGLKHYWDALLDADLECDALGWQYCAGCLSDAHPFEHVIDLESEAKRFDPKGNYVRRWIPVLARLPAKYIHAPWEAPADVLADAGVELGVNYPWPVVDMEESKEALAAVVKIVEESRDTSYNVGTSGGAVADGNAVGAATVTGVDVVAAATAAAANSPPLVANPSGPFRPPTIPDPSAAQRVWGAAAAVVLSDAGYAGAAAAADGGRHGSRGGIPASAVHMGAARAARSMRSVDESYNEEVESNAVGILGGGGGGATTAADYDTAADGSMLVHNNEVQQQHQQHEQEQQTAGGASAAVRGGGSGALAPVLTAARPPLPVPRSHSQRQQQQQQNVALGVPVVADVAEVVLVEGTTPGSNGGSGSGRRGGGASNGGSNRASLTVAVVPTISENPSAAQVPDIYQQEEGTEVIDDAELQAILQPQGDGLGTTAGRRSRSASPPLVALCGRAEGTTGGDHHDGRADSDNTAGGSEDDPVWPPEAKRQRQGSN
jgi:cryptochrome 2